MVELVFEGSTEGIEILLPAFVLLLRLFLSERTLLCQRCQRVDTFYILSVHFALFQEQLDDRHDNVGLDRRHIDDQQVIAFGSAFGKMIRSSLGKQ